MTLVDDYRTQEAVGKSKLSLELGNVTKYVCLFWLLPFSEKQLELKNNNDNS